MRQVVCLKCISCWVSIVTALLRTTYRAKWRRLSIVYSPGWLAVYIFMLHVIKYINIFNCLHWAHPYTTNTTKHISLISALASRMSPLPRKLAKCTGNPFRAVKSGILNKKDKYISKFHGVFDSLHIENNVIHLGSRIVIPPKFHDRLLTELHASLSCMHIYFYCICSK